MLYSEPPFCIIQYEKLDSTNQKLYQLTENGAEPWTFVVADFQSKGKGYSGNKWKSEANKNLTFSFNINYPFNAQNDISYVNMWVAWVLCEFLTDCQFNSFIKWPNDILINNKKLAGILIESKLQGNKTKFIIVGIGLNIYQTDFENLPKATSLVNENPNFNIDKIDLLENLIQYFIKNSFALLSFKFDEVYKNYLKYLYKYQETATYEFQGKKYDGILKGVDKNGNAIIDLIGINKNSFKHKEISLIY